MALMFWLTMYIMDVLCGEAMVILRTRAQETNGLVEWSWVGLPSCAMCILLVRLVVWQSSVDSSGSVVDILSVTACQWYWIGAVLDQSSQLPSRSAVELFWYCRGLAASASGDLRLVSVSSGVALSTTVVYRVQLGSSDVIHSFALPVLGIKADVVPGRVNSVVMVSLCSGMLSGQCSELCGSFHGFMPICFVLAA